ncbi:SEL1-like repeat protein [Alsobacter soli]|nr:SEL1-like repeat protein [Alsobacter soli]
MKQAIPWSVKGVDANARDAAKDAARRAGMTLGEWLNTVIVETASEREQREAHEQREAGEGREPADMRGQPERREPGADERGRSSQQDYAEEERAAEKLASLEARLEQLARRAADTALPRSAIRDERDLGEPLPERNDLASILERAMRENRARTDAVEEKTATALDSMVRFMERSDTRRRDEMTSLAQAQERTSAALKEALALVTGRMDSLERSISQKSSTELEPIKTAILRLEQRLESRAQAPDGSASARATASMKDLEARLVDIADKLSETEQNSKRDAERARSARIARIEQKLAAVLDVLDGRSPEPAPFDAADDEDEPTAPAHTLDEAISQIRARQERLQGARARRTEDNERTAALLDGLRGDVVNLSQRIDAMDERAFPTVEAMRRELADLARSVQAIHHRSDFAALERSVADLAGRVESWARSGSADAILGPAQRVMDDMRSLVDELRPVANLTALREDIGQLALKLDRAPAAGMPAEVVETILSQIADVRATVAKAARPVSLEPLEKQVAALGQRLDLVLAKRSRGGGGETASGLAELSDAAAEIREALGRLNPEETFSRLERRLDDIGQKIEASSRDSDRGEFDDLRSRLDRVQTTLERRTEAPDLSPLESMIRSLGEKLETVRSAPQDTPSLDDLAAQLSSMTAALERSGEGFTALRSMERSIGDLFAKIDDAKNGALEAADVAARKAAEQAAALFSSGGQARGGSEFAEVRTRQTLEAVHDTLEKIVERLGMLEADMASDRVRLLDVAEKATRTGSPAAASTSPNDRPAVAAASAAAQKMAAAAAAAEAARALAPEASRPAAPKPAPRPAAERPAQPPMLPVMDLAEDLPLEPGSGRPSPTAADPDAGRGELQESAQASFIAAARKAAQAAQAAEDAPKSLLGSIRAGDGAAKPAKKSKPAKRAEADLAETAAAGGSKVDQVRAYVEAKRRPILIGLAAVVLALSSAQVARNFLESETADPGASGPRIDVPARDPAKQSKAPAAAPEKQAAAPASAPPSAPAQSFTAAGPVNPPTTAFTRPGEAKDPTTVGSLGPAPSVATAPPLPNAPSLGPDIGQPSILLPAGQWPKGLQKAAEQNDPAALYEVASRLNDGRGAARDPKLAAKWFEKAAGLGLAPAQYRLGSIYEKGVGVPKDLAQAKSWYQRAADAGNAKAMHNLGVLIAEGAGGKPDYAAAAVWFRKAAELGVRDSQYNLAILTARGLGVQQNLRESWLWFSLAYAQGDQDAGKKRDEVAARMDADALKAAQAALQAFKAKPQDPKVNDVASPAGGWEQEPIGQQPLPKGKSARL